MLERNESLADRIVRAGLGGFLLGVALRARAARRRPLLAGLAGLAGAILLLTAATGTCGIYHALGISTYRG